MEAFGKKNSVVHASLNNPCNECKVSFDEEPQLRSHLAENHGPQKRNGGTFGYVLNEKKLNQNYSKVQNSKPSGGRGEIWLCEHEI